MTSNFGMLLTLMLAVQMSRHSSLYAQSTNVKTNEPEAQEVTTEPLPQQPTSADRNSEVEAILRMNGSESTSLGNPNNGDLKGAVAMPWSGPGFRYNPRRRPEARYGTVEMVQALIRAAATVEANLPGSFVMINDLSEQKGGVIAQHASHQNGRDVDILFYYLDTQGNPWPAKAVPIGPDGTGIDFNDLSDPDDDVQVSIDLPRTWRYAQALLEDPQTHLNRIFLVEHVRSMLLKTGEALNAPREVLERFAALTCQPSYPHDDHFHFRFYCNPEDAKAGCRDKGPIYPWHQNHMAEAGVRIRMATRPRRRSRTTSAAQALADAEDAQELHPSVRAYLKKREAWTDKPSPGRRYCP